MIWRLLALFTTLLIATPALAHPGHGDTGLIGGIAHPLTGADHVLAMVAVGLWAVQRGGSTIWAWPSAFVASMLGGFALARTGIVLPLVEPGIMASVIVLGLAIAASLRVNTAAGAAAIAVFGMLHGYAHGTEAIGGSIGFVAGFLVATVLLHVVGIGAAFVLRPGIARLAGAVTAAAGVAMVAL